MRVPSLPLHGASQLIKWTRQRYAASIGAVALCFTLTACSGSEALSPELLPENLLGEYALVGYGGQPLPAGNGRATYYGGKLVLERDQLYTQTVDVELCPPAVPCTRSTSSSGGTWLLLHDGTLYFDPHQGYGWPPPRIEADGQEIRFYIPDMNTLTFTYRRK